MRVTSHLRMGTGTESAGKKHTPNALRAAARPETPPVPLRAALSHDLWALRQKAITTGDPERAMHEKCYPCPENNCERCHETEPGGY
jgi:hypothetical protein